MQTKEIMAKPIVIKVPAIKMMIIAKISENNKKTLEDNNLEHSYQL